MRVLVIGLDASLLKPDSAAAERQREYYRGWEVDIVVLVPGKALQIELSSGLKVWTSGGSNKGDIFLKTWRLLRRLVKEYSYDVVTVQDPLWCGVLGSRAAVWSGAAFHVQDHSAFFARSVYSLQDRLLLPLARRLVRRAHRVRTVSQRGYRELVIQGVSSKRIDVIPIATDCERFTSVPPASTDTYHVLCVARLEHEKGVDVLLDAWRYVISEIPDAQLRIVGGGSLASKLEERAVSLGIQSSVDFVGSQSDVLPHLAWSDVVVQPSRFEGWGLSVIEAAVSHRPVVMTDVGCAGEVIVDGESGIVVPIEDSRALADALRRLFRHREEAARLAEAAWLRVKTLSTPAETAASVHHSLERSATEAKKPRSLICIQAVDEQDPLMGFFVGWLKEFSHHSDAIVCALRVGHPVPDVDPGIDIRPTRSSSSRSRLEVLWNVARTSWHERHHYQSVFIRGDGQYPACLGWLWRLLGKRIIFWYTHYNARSPWFWLGVLWSHEILTAVEESNPLASSIKIGHHIDTFLFSPLENPEPRVPRVLLFGRVSAVKRIPWILATINQSDVTCQLPVTIVGAAADSNIRREVEAVLPVHTTWHDIPIPFEETPKLYREHDIFISATPGSMDKTILEAAASGCLVLAASSGMRHGLPSDLRWLVFSSQDELRGALERALSLSSEERRKIGLRLRDWVIRCHSLSTNVPRVVAFLNERAPRPLLRQRLKRWGWRLSQYRELPPGLSILMFHAMDGRGVAAWDVYRFQALIARLLSRHVPIFRLRDVWNGQIFDTTSPGVILTVDDATEDLLNIVPVLERERLSMAVFAPSNLSVLKSSEHISRCILGREELSGLVQSGVIEVGGHGVTHTPLPGLSEDWLKRETEGSYAYVRSFDQGAPPVFAYPKGKWDERSMKMVKAVGFTAAFGVQPGRWTPSSPLFHIPRLPVLVWMTSRDLESCLLSTLFDV